MFELEHQFLSYTCSNFSSKNLTHNVWLYEAADLKIDHLPSFDKQYILQRL